MSARSRPECPRLSAGRRQGGDHRRHDRRNARNPPCLPAGFQTGRPGLGGTGHGRGGKAACGAMEVAEPRRADQRETGGPYPTVLRKFSIQAEGIGGGWPTGPRPRRRAGRRHQASAFAAPAGRGFAGGSRRDRCSTMLGLSFGDDQAGGTRPSERFSPEPDGSGTPETISGVALSFGISQIISCRNRLRGFRRCRILRAPATNKKPAGSRLAGFLFV
ncbi:MAG: hypothetical protein JWR80_667 [Bradyrhizobium sp.]|nr:hypothetical protein [Bradyrhizobium sp.]